jgi:hypothetical protein
MRRTPAERLVDAAIGVPVAMAGALRRLVPMRTTRLERAVACRLRGVRPRHRDGDADLGASDLAAVDAGAADLGAAELAGGHVESADADQRPASSATGDHVDGDAGESADSQPAALPIDGYDQLSARQIVDRLGGLSAAELAAVDAHERAHRRRQTVLSRIAQLS